jgi:hypothetical protein
MISNNVLQFPRTNEKAHEPDLTDVENDPVQAVAAMHLLHVENCLQAIMHDVLTNMYVGGYATVTKEAKYHKDIALVSSSIRSLMLKARNIEHPFHEIAQNLFEEEEPGVLVLSVPVVDENGDVQ